MRKTTTHTCENCKKQFEKIGKKYYKYCSYKCCHSSFNYRDKVSETQKRRKRTISSIKKGIETKRKNGTLNLSEISKKKIGKSNKGKKRTEKTKSIMRERAKGRLLGKSWVDRVGEERAKEILIKISNKTKEAMNKPEIKEKHKQHQRISQLLNPRGEKISKSVSKAFSEGKGHKINHRLQYKGIYMRSSWEIKVAQWLDENNIEWKFEPQWFKLEKNLRYLPDFFLPEKNTFLEVKGFLREKDKLKMNKFIELGNELLYIDNIKKINLHTKWVI